MALPLRSHQKCANCASIAAPVELDVSGQYAYLSYFFPMGLHVVDMSVPSSPAEIGLVEFSFGDGPSFTDVAIAGLGSEYAVAAAYQSAFLVFEQCELPVFSDGFESGNTSAWSTTVP